MRAVEIFKAGNQTDSAGNAKEWSLKELDTIAQKYNENTEHEAPVVIGHPKNNDPAYGWVDKTLRRDGNSLYADFHEVMPEFAELVQTGRFKKRSISLYPDLTLRHVGFLGAMPPAIKGLKDVQFSESDCITIEFGEDIPLETETTESMEEIRNLEDIISQVNDIYKEVSFHPKIYDKNGSPVIRNLFKVLIENLNKFKQGKEAKAKMDENVITPEANFAEQKEPEAKKEEVKTSDFSEKEKSYQEKIKELERQIAQKEAEAKRKEYSDFCEKNITKVTPAWKDSVINFMEMLDKEGEFEFSDGKKDTVTKFQEFIQALPEKVTLQEIATKNKASEKASTKTKDFSEMGNVDPARMELHERVLEYMENNAVTYAEAITEVLKR